MLRNELPKIITESLPGPKAAALIARRDQAIPSAIKCVYPVAIKRGEGAMVEDLDGNYFLDWIGGVGVLNIGFTHPEVVEAVKEQADKYFHCMFNMMTHEGYVALAEKLCEITPVKGDKKRAFFANSGAEAAENAVKVAKSFTGRPNIVVFSHAFHGRTSLTMTMSAKKGLAKGVGPFPSCVSRAEYPYMFYAPDGLSYEEKIEYFLKSLRTTLEEGTLPEECAAIILEPVLGDGGFAHAPIEWVQAVRKICDEHGILLIADEVQCAWGRTGRCSCPTTGLRPALRPISSTLPSPWPAAFRFPPSSPGRRSCSPCPAASSAVLTAAMPWLALRRSRSSRSWSGITCPPVRWRSARWSRIANDQWEKKFDLRRQPQRRRLHGRHPVL